VCVLWVDRVFLMLCQRGGGVHCPWGLDRNCSTVCCGVGDAPLQQQQQQHCLLYSLLQQATLPVTVCDWHLYAAAAGATVPSPPGCRRLLHPPETRTTCPPPGT
jgi:hypothetical protein